MADHLVTGLLEVQVTCGNLSCGRTWRQPGLDPMERLDWIVCPHCCTAAPVNVRDDLGTAFDPEPARRGGHTRQWIIDVFNAGPTGPIRAAVRPGGPLAEDTGRRDVHFVLADAPAPGVRLPGKLPIEVETAEHAGKTGDGLDVFNVTARRWRNQEA